MARVIRNCWVYRPLHRYKYLPRPKYGYASDFVAERDVPGPSEFPQRLEGPPPKLWLAWVHKPSLGTPGSSVHKENAANVQALFGPDWEPGKPEVFKNTPSVNKSLWRVKHLIEMRPVSFPSGEPSEADVWATVFSADGACRVDRHLLVDAETVERPFIGEEKELTTGYIKTKLQAARTKTFNVDEDVNLGDPKKSYFG